MIPPRPAPPSTPLKTFLRENWIWIAAPIAVFALVLAAIFLLADDGASPFVYDLGR